MGIDVFDPSTPRDETMASALDDFSTFVLLEEREQCLSIIQDHLGNTVGELQGGSAEHEIYRISFTENSHDAAALLLESFYQSPQGRRYQSILTLTKLQQYMLSMCERRSKKRYNARTKYKQLGNTMFILAFGPTQGQVRHIDDMDPNLQICLYMSQRCPSTIVYNMGGLSISNTHELLTSWEQQGKSIPALVQLILETRGDIDLSGKFYTRYFASSWRTLNDALHRFGKLYRPIRQQLSLETEPGTTMIVGGGNQVHAGPPTKEPRMFAFATGIPEAQSDEFDDGEDKDGEIQYNPVLLHLDLMHILFGIFDFEYADRGQDTLVDCKVFLLRILVEWVTNFPKETYARLIGDDRSEVRQWIGKLVVATQMSNDDAVTRLLQEAVESDSLLYTPQVCRRRAKKKKRTKTF